jgi:helicase
MRLSDLDKWGIPDRIIEAWRERQGESLLPVQSRAVRKGLLGEQKDSFEQHPVRMLISAPTSSGKSFCAEMAMVKALTRRRKTVVLVPLKSLAEHRHNLFQETYGGLGVKCLVVTGDHPENDKKFADGDYQIAVAIYEKFDLLLTAALDSLKNMGLVVVDEIQTVSEPGRGALLERLLTKIISSVYDPSLVSLSAVIGDSACSAGQLAEWLGAVLVEETARPIDLVRGVAAEGTFCYRSYNSGLDGSEPFVKIEAAEEPFDAFIQQIKSDVGSTLVFLKSRRETVDCAFRLAAAVGWPEAKSALENLSEEEPSFLVRSLRQALTRSVAFHNADLSPRQRAIIEQAFIDREVKVIFSTTTLALGVDLPADTVYLETVKYSSGEYNTRPALVPVTRAEFDNMTGRAGRLRDGNSKPGRAIVLADSDFDREILWENYIAPDRPESATSAFNSMPLEDWLLNMIVSGLISDVASMKNLFGKTFFACLNGEQKAPDFEASLAILSKRRLITTDGSQGKFSATSVGRATARSGLSAAQAVCFLDKLQSIHPRTFSGWVALALSASGWTLPPGTLTGFELSDNVPMKMLHQHFDYLLEEAGILLGDNYHREPLSYIKAAKLKAFLLLHDWSRLVAVQQLEERFQMHLGQIMALGETAAHLVSGLGLLVEASDNRTPMRDELGRHAFSLRFGMPSDLQQLYSHLGDILNRSDFSALCKAGVESVADLSGLSGEQLDKIIKEKNKPKSLKEKLKLLHEEAAMQSSAVTSNSRASVGSALSVRPESVEIDGTFERERYLVIIDGFPVRLTGKSFKYFAKLAWSRLHRDAGWMYKEDIEVGFNQARYLYRMKNEVISVLSLSWPVFENNRLGYYRLNADPSAIHINIENLKTHPDYEVRSLAGETNAEMVN